MPADIMNAQGVTAHFRTAGCDEVGRGPLAGDVVAAAVILGPSIPEGLNDSKKLTERKRERLFDEIKASAVAKQPLPEDSTLLEACLHRHLHLEDEERG